MPCNLGAIARRSVCPLLTNLPTELCMQQRGYSVCSSCWKPRLKAGIVDASIIQQEPIAVKSPHTSLANIII